jgi:alpha-glucosidase
MVDKYLEFVMKYVKLNKYWIGILSLLVLILVSTVNTVQAQGFENFSDGPVYAMNFEMLKYDNAVNAAQESRIDTFTIEIPQLGGRQRNIQVYLPPDYDSSDKNYPVFYLHAGQYLFNPPPEANGDYNVDETLDRLFLEGLIDGVIVVGIEIDYEYDWLEYSPWMNENMHDWVSRSAANASEGGEGFAFLDFIVFTLKPEIDSRYRTRVDRENTAIGGFCNNGFLPIIAGIEYSNVFSKVMAMSPAVWFAEGGGRWLSNNRLLQYIADHSLSDDVKFYIDMGSDESSGRDPRVRDQDGKRITYPQAYVEGAQVLVDVLKESGVPDSNIFFRVIEGSTGSRDERAMNFDEVVLWLFTDVKIDPDVTTVETPVDEEPASNSQGSGTEDEALPENEVFLPGIQNQENNEQQGDSSVAKWIAIGFGIVVVSFGLGYRLLK